MEKEKAHPKASVVGRKANAFDKILDNLIIRARDIKVELEMYQTREETLE